MNLGLIDNSNVIKKLFKLKPLRNDGLLFRIHHTTCNTKIRFIHGCFHHSTNILSIANSQGIIFIIDYSLCRFWGLPKLDSCTFIAFSPHNHKHLLTGLKTGNILICDIDSGNVQHKLKGHKLAVTGVSFDKQRYCLSTSRLEAFIWDLETATKVQVLNLETDCSLKYVAFVPFSGKVVACFQDDLIQIWSPLKFKTVKQFSPSNWKNYSVRSITFTRNGEFMVVSGHVPTLGIFQLDTSKVLKIINLSEYLKTVKQIEFVSQVFDGGCNKILGILSGQGVVYFFDVEQNEIISELCCDMEINKITCSPDGTHIICILCSGEVEVFDIKQYVMPPKEIHIHKIRNRLKINRKRCLNEVKYVKQEMKNMLEIKRLKFILKEHLEYPESFRTKIWEHLLQLPNNIHKYNNVINHVTVVAFEDLYDKYPLEDKTFLKVLKRSLNNLVTWCPFFAYVEYMPIFAFPFVKVFHNKPVACFEAICTVILNWCQHWFEYFPLAPVNILAIAENMLLEHDPELLYHFTLHKVTSNIYIWSVLETIFSEILTSSEWLTLWDHILTNEVSFLLSAVVAYNLVQRHTLMILKNLEDIEIFYKNQNPVDIKKLIKTSYCVLKNTSEKFHPRQYLNKFRPLNKGNYTLFFEYPKKLIDIKEEQTNKLDNYMINLLANECNLTKIKEKSAPEGVTLEIQEEEKRRLREVEKLCSNQITARRDLVIKEEKRLKRMQENVNKNYMDEQVLKDDILTNSISLYQTGSKGDSNENRKGGYEEKLHMAMNCDLLSRFIRKLAVELKSNGEECNVTSHSSDNIESQDKSMNIDLLNKFIKKLNIEIKENSDKCQCVEKTKSAANKITNLSEEEKRKRSRQLLNLSDVVKRTQSSSSSFKECKHRSSEECGCEILCPKMVRFTSSTTGGSVCSS